MTNKEAMQILQMYKDEIEQRIDTANAPEVKDVYRWQMDGFNVAFKALETDATEVIRCKDCKYSRIEGNTTRYRWCKCLSVAINDNDYCSYAER